MRTSFSCCDGECATGDQNRIPGVRGAARLMPTVIGALALLLLTTSASALTATFNSATDIPVTSSGYTASGSLTLVLNYSPSAGTALTVVKNTAITPINGTFTGLAQGGTISATFGGRSYTFVANYWGGTGNDLVLVWPDTGLVGWGWNAYGQLGDGTFTDQRLPVEVNTSGVLAGKTILAVANGYGHSLALTSEGKVYAWGNNFYSQLGDGTTTNRLEPVAVNMAGALAGKTVIAIAAGFYHSLALTTEGKMYAWGDNTYDQLGAGSGAPLASAVPVAVIDTGYLAGKFVATISVGGDHNLALASDGLVFAWGRNSYGALGVGTSGDQYFAPVPVTTTAGSALDGKVVQSISAGGYFSTALTNDGVIAAWGANAVGELGDGTTTDRLVPAAVVQTGVLAGKLITSLRAGGGHVLAMSSTGQGFAWGYNYYAQTGDGAWTRTARLEPVAVYTSTGALAGRTVAALGGGFNHSLALAADGSLAAWGHNVYGQIGNGSLAEFTVDFYPEPVNQNGVLRERAVTGLATLAPSYHNTVIYAKAPEINVEDNGSAPATVLADGAGSVNFGTVLPPGNVSRTFTIRNSGTLPLTGFTVTVDGTNSADFTVTQQPPVSSLAPGGSTTFIVRFAPAVLGTRSAALHVSSNDLDESSFDIEVAGTGGTPDFAASFTTADQIISTASSFAAAGLNLQLSLGFAPAPGTNLTVVRNTGAAPISGRFSNAAQGGWISAVFNGVTYWFVVNYFGGSGNDLELAWPHTALTAWGSAVAKVEPDGTRVDGPTPTLFDKTGVLSGKTLFTLNRLTYPNNGARLASAVLTSEGEAWTWGDNANGQLGMGSTAITTEPVKVLSTGVIAGRRLVRIACSRWMLAVTEDGQVVSWGDNSHGSLGDGTTTSHSSPVAVVNTGALAGKTVVDVATGSWHSVALTSDGKLFAWGGLDGYGSLGNGTTGSSTVPVAVDMNGVLTGKTVVAIACCEFSTLVLTSDGLIAGWGRNTYGQLGDGTTADRITPVLVNQSGALAGKTVVSIAASYINAMALTADGMICSWGYNGSGQLGDGTTTQSTVPVPVVQSGVLAGKTVKQIAPGGTANYALTSDGLPFAWGFNLGWELGNGTTTNSSVPVAVSASGFLSGRPISSLAGAIGIWSRPSQVYLHDAGVTPVNVVLDDDAVDFGDVIHGTSITRSFAVGNSGSTALTGFAVSFDGVNAADYALVAAPPSSIAAGGAATITVRCLPTGAGVRTAAMHLTFTNAGVPSFDVALLNDSRTSLTGSFASASDVLLTTNEFDCTNRQLNLTLNFAPSLTTELMVIQKTNLLFLTGYFNGIPQGGTVNLEYNGRTYTFVADYFGGSGNDLVLKPVFTGVAAAGANGSGQLGDNSTTNRSLPVNVSGIGGSGGVSLLSVSSGATHSLAIKRDGTVVAWGANESGQLGDGTNTSRLTPVPVSTSGGLAGKTVVGVAAGTSFSLAVTSEGQVFTWGLNNNRQLGNGTTTSSNVPTLTVFAALAGKTIVAVAAGQLHSVALTGDGGVIAWGWGGDGQTGNSSAALFNQASAPGYAYSLDPGAGVIAIAAGGIHTMVLRANGVSTFGGNASGQLGITSTGGEAYFPGLVSASGIMAGKTFSAIAAGASHSLALSDDGMVFSWGLNTSGQLGDGSTTLRNAPVAVNMAGALAGKSIRSISGGAATSHFLASDGGLYSCGLNSSGQLGNNSTTDSPLPVAATTASGALLGRPVTAIGASSTAAHLLAVAAIQAVQPDISVEQPVATVLADGVSTIDFGSTSVGTPVVKTFTVRNTGNAPLTLTTITKDGTSAADFTIGSLSLTSLSPAATATFNVTFTPSSGGAKTAAIHIGSDDANENPFDINLTGAGDPPDIAVEQPVGTNLSDGGSVAFGNVDATAGTTLIFTIRNTGLGGLTGVAITFDGANSGDFSITQAPASTVAAGGSTTFNLRCLPLGLGARTAALHIASNDPDESPFDLALSCTGTGVLPLPEIVVEDTTGATVNLTDGDGVGFGSLETTQNVTRNFTVRNTGTVALTGLAITIDGTNSGDFTVTQALASSVAAGGSTTFIIRCQPGALGARSAALHLANNDPDESPFNLVLTCTGVPPLPAPEIVVEDTTSGTADLTDGGSVAFGTVALVQQATRTFTVRNTGTASLTGLSITLDGTNSGDFTVTQAPASTVAAGGSTTFAVRCQPLAAGARTAALHLANNDANESPFDLTLTCTGVDAEVVSVTFNSAAEIPITATGYTATNKVLSITLNFVPTFSTSLMVIKNTAQGFISGTFNGLPQGAQIELIHLNKSYPFIADYYGGTGNDLVLVPINTTIAAAGTNAAGQLGDTTTTNRSTSITVSGIAGVAGRTVLAVASGQSHSLALTRDGVVFAWGSNGAGQLGDGTNTDRTTPVAVNTSGVLAGKTVIAIAAGEQHSVVLTTEGKVYAWGWNSVGQLGDGTTTNRNTPVEVVSTGVLSGKTVVAVAAGGNHTIALTADNLLFAWGWNSYGQIGDNSAFTRSSPVAVNTSIGIPAGKTYVSVAAGGVHSMVLTSDGKIYTWGRNNNGQLGDASTTNRLTPVPVVTSGVLNGKTITAIAGGGFHSNALSSDNLLYAWGLNSSGQLGDNTLTQNMSPVTTVVSALTGRAVTHLSASAASTHVRLADGAIYSSGLNSGGQLAVGDTNNRSLLTPAVTASGGLQNRPSLELGPSTVSNHLLMLTAIDPPGGFGALLAHEIVVEDSTGGGTVNLTDNTGSVAFGSTLNGTPVVRSFTVRNTGNATLTLSGITKDGTNAADFTVGALSGSSLAPAATATFSVTFNPAASGSKTAAIHLGNDDANENPFDVNLTGSGLNNAPTISDIADQAVNLSTSTGALSFAIGDVETAAGSLTVSGSSNNATLVPNANIIFGGAGANRTVTVTPAANASGTATITIQVSDGVATANDTFVLTVLSAAETWRSTYFGTSANTGSAADTFDFDGDGLPNIVEFAFGLNPTLASSLALPQPQLSGGNLTITFTQPSGVTGITYGAEWSTTLAGNSWTPITDTGSGGTHTFSVTIGTNTKLFMRLKVTGAP